jgi:hypothetical protein
MTDIVDILDGAESVPVNEVLFDSVAVCVAANGAKARAVLAGAGGHRGSIPAGEKLPASRRDVDEFRVGCGSRPLNRIRVGGGGMVLESRG